MEEKVAHSQHQFYRTQKVHVADGSCFSWRYESSLCFRTKGPRFFRKFVVTMISKLFVILGILVYYKYSRKYEVKMTLIALVYSLPILWKLSEETTDCDWNHKYFRIFFEIHFQHDCHKWHFARPSLKLHCSMFSSHNNNFAWCFSNCDYSM